MQQAHDVPFGSYFEVRIIVDFSLFFLIIGAHFVETWLEVHKVKTVLLHQVHCKWCVETNAENLCTIDIKVGKSSGISVFFFHLHGEHIFRV